MGFNTHILSGRSNSRNLDNHAAVAASFNPTDSIIRENALVRAVHEQDFGGMDAPNVKVLDLGVWESFRENFWEQRHLATWLSS